MRNIFFLFFLISLHSQAQDVWFPSGSCSAAMGKTSATAIDVWSVSNNQAGMAFAQNASVGFYYENRFLLKELGYSSLAFTLPTLQGSFGATLTHSGDVNFSQMQAGFAYAKSFGKRFATGLKFDYLQTKLAENYGKHANLTFEAGILAKISNNLWLGAHAFNPVRVRLSDYNNERIPTLVNLGVSYIFSEKLLFNAEVVKDSERPADFRFGAEYQFIKFGYVRAGLTTESFSYTFGFGFLLDRFSFDLSSAVDQMLGVSPQVSLQYHFASFQN